MTYIVLLLLNGFAVLIIKSKILKFLFTVHIFKEHISIDIKTKVVSWNS